MTEAEFKSILEKLRNGEIDLVSALAKAGAPENISDLGFAKIDHERHRRCGFPEFVYGEGKTAGQLVEIVKAIRGKGHAALVTRLAPENSEALMNAFPEGEYSELAKVFRVSDNPPPQTGNLVLIITAGTTDLPVALEAKYTVELCGHRAELVSDSGVAGIHRLFAHSSKLKEASVIIAVAGMEGALPSVIGGLVSCPVIAVPTSVGYGASLRGMTALFSMLNSCANGLTVVNIDNGFGAGCAAARILNKTS